MLKVMTKRTCSKMLAAAKPGDRFPVSMGLARIICRLSNDELAEWAGRPIAVQLTEKNQYAAWIKILSSPTP